LPKELNLGEISPAVEKKVFTIADEVFKILKELSVENKTKINSNLIAERMFWNDSLKSILNNIHAITEDEEIESDCINELSHMLLDKFSELIPVYMASRLAALKDALHNKTIDGDSTEWIDSPIGVVKTYIDSISTRNSELENFLTQTMDYTSITEKNTTMELIFQQQMISDDIAFEKGISANIDEIKKDLISSGDLNNIKAVLIKKIEDIYGRIETKRIQDVQHRRETERTLDELNARMSVIKRDANEIWKKSKFTEYEASHDTLTGVSNRKAYEKKMEEILADVTRYNISASLMVCDIDFFMNINNKWGHKVGDLALRRLATLIKEMMRTNDFIARYGGEEFAIILPHTNLEGAQRAGERLREYVDKANFSYKEETIPLTISVGVSSFRRDDNIDVVFKRADHALRQVKRTGRNKVKIED
jgi:diguanylate cyclase